MPMQSIIGLPVADLDRSKAFFTALGFSINPYVDDENMANIIINDASSVMLYSESAFAGYTGHERADLSNGREVMLGFAAESRGQVDEISDKALAAGATALGEPQESDGLYMRAFLDPDGHWWSLNHIDM